MRIRKATKKDLKACAEIFWKESNRSPYSKDRTLKTAIQRIKWFFKGNDKFVAVIEGKVAGFSISSQDPDTKNQVYVSELWISKDYQGKGVGKKFMKYLESFYKNKGVKKIKLVASTEKGGAEGFYKKIHYKIDKNMVFMEKRLK